MRTPSTDPTGSRRLARRGVVAASLLGILAVGLGAALAPEEGLAVRAATIDEPINGRSAVVRLTIDNETDADDVLHGVSTDVGRATLHESQTTDDGLATMIDASDMAIPAGSETTFEAGGRHIMITQFARPLAIGDVVELTLSFERAGTRTVVAEVTPLGTFGGDDHEHGGH